MPDGRLINLDRRELRPVGGGSFGLSLDLPTLRRLGAVENDRVTLEEVRVEMYDSGRIVIDLPVDEREVRAAGD